MTASYIAAFSRAIARADADLARLRLPDHVQQDLVPAGRAGAAPSNRQSPVMRGAGGRLERDDLVEVGLVGGRSRLRRRGRPHGRGDGRGGVAATAPEPPRRPVCPRPRGRPAPRWPGPGQRSRGVPTGRREERPQRSALNSRRCDPEHLPPVDRAEVERRAVGPRDRHVLGSPASRARSTARVAALRDSSRRRARSVWSAIPRRVTVTRAPAACAPARLRSTVSQPLPAVWFSSSCAGRPPA